jgi:uncharacterized membrane protein YfcA
MAAGFAAGCVAGLFGGGGGMVLVPLLSMFSGLQEEEIFPASLSVMLPVCLTALLLSGGGFFREALPFLPGSLLGGWLAGMYGARIPVKWLHRVLGILILWGGIRYLC